MVGVERGPPDGYVMMTTPAGQERSRYLEVQIILVATYSYDMEY